MKKFRSHGYINKNVFLLTSELSYSFEKWSSNDSTINLLCKFGKKLPSGFWFIGSRYIIF